MTSRSTNQRHLLHVPSFSASTCSNTISSFDNLQKRSCHVKRVRTLNRNTHTLNFNSGDETWMQHRGNIPKQRRLCAVRKSSHQDRGPIVQLDIDVQRGSSLLPGEVDCPNATRKNVAWLPSSGGISMSLNAYILHASGCMWIFETL